MSEFDQLRADQAAEREHESARAEEAFRAYQQALTDGNPAAAIPLVTDVTLQWYEESLRLAQSGTTSELEAAPIHKFVSALQLRALLGSEVHALASGEEAFGVLIENRIPMQARTDGDFRVKVSSPAFDAVVYYGHRDTIWTLQLHDGVWLVNVQYFNSFLGFINEDLTALEVLTGVRQTRNEYVERLEAAVGTSVSQIPAR